MIKYSLVCAADHAFDGWFRSSVDFDEQASQGALTCPHCASSAVRKGVMAPAIQPSRASTARIGPEEAAARAERMSAQQAEGRGPDAVARIEGRSEVMSGPIRAEIAEAVERARAYVEKHFDYVGDRFPEEARRIHYGETPARPVYGEATLAEARELLEEGVSVAPLPGAGPAGPAAKSKLN